MNRSKKRKNRLFPMLITVMVLTAVLTPAAYADTDGTEPKITRRPRPTSPEWASPVCSSG